MGGDWIPDQVGNDVIKDREIAAPSLREWLAMTMVRQAHHERGEKAAGYRLSPVWLGEKGRVRKSVFFFHLVTLV